MPREELVGRLFAAFRKHGYDNASLSVLAEEVGLAKAALYHHFPGGKVDMARAVLESVGGWMGGNVFAPLHAPGDPRQRLVAMTRTLDGFYDGGGGACLLALFSLGEAQQHFREVIRGGTEAWISAIAAVLHDAGFAPEQARLRAREAIIRIQGSLVVSRALADREPFQAVMRGLPDQLLAP